MSFDVEKVRARFPSLAVTDDGLRRVYFDNPGGTQVPQSVIDRTVDCLVRANANLGGHFSTSLEAGALVEEAHAAMADLLGASDPAEIVFGQNMTSLTFHMSRSIGLELGPGDEVIVTRMDHDANISPWLLMARDRGVTVRWLDFDRRSFEFDLARLEEIVGPRTRVLAINHASNATGTVNDVAEACRIVKRAQPAALVYVDAVQMAPHALIDVQAIGCDFLVCSPYKFFGPHQGVLYGRREVLERLQPYKVRPAGDALPDRFETGTLSHEGMAGTLGAVEHFEWIGRSFGGPIAPRDGESARRAAIRAAWAVLEPFETNLTLHLIEGLKRLPGVTIQGISEPSNFRRRVPTVSFTHDRLAPSAISRALAEDGIFVWDGHNYAVEVIRSLGLYDKGGVLRVGLAHYNTAEEVDLLLDRLSRLVARTSN